MKQLTIVAEGGGEEVSRSLGGSNFFGGGGREGGLLGLTGGTFFVLKSSRIFSGVFRPKKIDCAFTCETILQLCVTVL